VSSLGYPAIIPMSPVLSASATAYLTVHFTYHLHARGKLPNAMAAESQQPYHCFSTRRLITTFH